MVNTTPLRLIAGFALVLGLTGISIAAPLPESPVDANSGSTLIFTDLGSAAFALNKAPEVTRSTSLPEPASTGVVCLGLAALACRFGRRRTA